MLVGTFVMQRGNELWVVQKKIEQRVSKILTMFKCAVCENARRLESETGCAEVVQRCQTSDVGTVQPVYNPQCYSTSTEALPRGQNNLTATRNNRLFHSAGNSLHVSSSSAPDTWQRCPLRCASATDAHWPAILSAITWSHIPGYTHSPSFLSVSLDQGGTTHDSCHIYACSQRHTNS